MGRKSSKSPSDKRKKVSISLLERVHAGKTTTPYRFLDELVESYHRHLLDARIAIAWNMAPPKEDADGRVTLYRVKKEGDLDREKWPFDFVIIISHEAWQPLSDHDMKALLDEALCHFAVVKDKDNEIKTDTKDRAVYRVRRPDVKTFKENVARFGLWRPEVGEMVEASRMFNDQNRPLIKQLEAASTNDNGKHKTTNRMAKAK